MPDALSGLLHDATAVYRFVDFICAFCDRKESQQTYGEASEDFFDYVIELGESTRRFLQSIVDEAKSDPKRIPIYRTNLATIKKCWAELHVFVKPAADGHSLQTPTPFLAFMEQQLSELPSLAGARIVILISPELNYLQYQHSKLKGFASELSRTIPKSPTFPAKLGFIAIPFSQGGTVFTNTLIYHELGHFVFEELNKRRTLNAAITSALTRTLRNAYTSLGYDEKAWCRSQLAIWAEETFCDLFALWVSGPAYSFASIELLSLLGMLGTSGAKDFDSEHPPFAFRFSEHYDQLKKHKWWAAIESMSADHPKLIKEMGAVDPKEYRYEFQELVPAFLELRDAIRDLVKTTVGNRDPGFEAFKEWKSNVHEHLLHGIVPSTSHGKGKQPLAAALINSAFCFYLDSLAELVKKVKDLDPSIVEHRSDIARRVEMWTLKALEDCHLLSRHSQSQAS